MLSSNKRNTEAIKEMENKVRANCEIQRERKKDEAKKRYLETINGELERKNEADLKIKKLEGKESKLILLLRKTNELEELARQDLQKIINGENPEFFDDLEILGEEEPRSTY